MKFNVLTIFPEIITSAVSASILGKALERGHIAISTTDIRDHATDKHSMVDDYPYGGGPGMVMKPEPIYGAVQSLSMPAGAPLILLTPQGERFTHAMAKEFASFGEIALLCGRYEGFDERVRELFPVKEVSLGDFVLTGGEFAALAIIDAVSRFIPGVLGDEDSPTEESFAASLLEYPQYTRPAEFMGSKVPEILLSGDHGKVDRWRREQSLLRTLERRPDLLETAELTEEDRKFLEKAKICQFSDNESEK
ncbi:MAG: tRNA (guanosine(37)-N1)-methyltransferase TrmD [bacterium]|nr:tRNA (guanosine(37)-N1)-methyltransferase TrmD [bacterium]MDT8395156.1 tRNA (guanosine(37)-N1)-methyltransferase TrmD [bacterium]